jgi:hypothetical protein
MLFTICIYTSICIIFGYKQEIGRLYITSLTNLLVSLLEICCEKDLIYTKSVDASNFVQSERYFSQHINQGKCFEHSDLMIGVMFKTYYITY